MGVACQSSHPLKAEFSAAVLAMRPVVLDSPETADKEAVERFIRRHGQDALPLYREVIRRGRHTEDGVEALELAAAIEGLAAIEKQAAVPTIRELVLDERVPLEALDNTLSALERLSLRDAVRAAGQRLLSERNESVRLRLVFYLRSTRSPEGVPFLMRALGQEKTRKFIGRWSWPSVC